MRHVREWTGMVAEEELKAAVQLFEPANGPITVTVTGPAGAREFLARLLEPPPLLIGSDPL